MNYLSLFVIAINTITISFIVKWSLLIRDSLKNMGAVRTFLLDHDKEYQKELLELRRNLNALNDKILGIRNEVDFLNAERIRTQQENK